MTFQPAKTSNNNNDDYNDSDSDSGDGRYYGLGYYNKRNEDDEEDARSILFDIDTQWGSMPQGGAYKDSETYSPEEYAYYSKYYGYYWNVILLLYVNNISNCHVIIFILFVCLWNINQNYSSSVLIFYYKAKISNK